MIINLSCPGLLARMGLDGLQALGSNLFKRCPACYRAMSGRTDLKFHHWQQSHPVVAVVWFGNTKPVWRELCMYLYIMRACGISLQYTKLWKGGVFYPLYVIFQTLLLYNCPLINCIPLPFSYPFHRSRLPYTTPNNRWRNCTASINHFTSKFKFILLNYSPFNLA